MEPLTDTDLHENGSASVKLLKHAGTFEDENKFRLPTCCEKSESGRTYQKRDLILDLRESQLIGKNNRLQYYKLDEQDILDASDVLHLELKSRRT